MNEESLEENNMDDTRSVQIIIFLTMKKNFCPAIVGFIRTARKVSDRARQRVS
jgi:hypothetical protein